MESQKRKIIALVMAVMMVFGIAADSGNLLLVNAEETVAAEDNINNDLKLWYTSPANIDTAETSSGDWMQQSLPLGNGNLGNLIFGGISRERIHFNEKTLWTGGPSDSRPNYQFGNKSTAYTAEEIEEYRLILDDKSTNVFNDSMSGYGYVPIRFPGESNLYKGSYQDFGDIWLDFSAMGVTDSNVTDYRRELDLQTGVAATTFTYDGVDYTREHFVSSPDNVMVTKVSASDLGKIDVTIQMELNNSGLSGTTSLNTSENTCTIDGTVTDNGLKFRTTMKVIPTGGTITADTTANTYTVTDADSIMIVMAAETDYLNDYPTYRDTEKNLTEVVDGRVAAAAQKAYEALKESHIADHQSLFDRVSLDLGEAVTGIPTNELMDQYREGEYSKYLEVLSFQFGRYLTIAGSRGTLPSNLVGLWTVGDSAWTGDYHFNVNVQMNYWPVYVTNLAECGTTMVEYMENLREPGRLTAERVHGIEGAVDNHTGFVVHTENNPFGMTAPTNSQEYGWNPTGAAWAIQNLWAHYEFTQDEAYLEDVIYPIMKEAALFWDQYLWTSGYQVIDDETSPYDGEARLVVAPSFSEEQGPTAIGTTYDQSLVWELYNECVKAGTIVGEDAELLAQWEENMQRLDPIEINATNGIKEWYEETRVGTESGHNQSYAQAGTLAEIAVPNSGWNIGHPGEQRHASHLVGLYPGTLINKENEEYMNAAIQSLTERGEYSTGWSKANKINLWARTGNGEKAYKLLNNLIGGKSSGLQYNLFDSHGSGGGETMMNGTPVWQIDGNYGLTAGVAEMLIQSQLGYVQFLPAIPDAWDEGEVQGLKARGNFTVGQIWYNGVADKFTVCYEGDEASSEFVGEYTNITDAKVYADGDEINVTKDEATGRISFEATQGVVYTIDMAGANAELVKENAESFLEEIHPDLNEAKEELQEAITEEAADLNEVLRKVKLMDQMYREYLEEAENIYYMTTKEGLTDKEIDQMYCDLRQMKDALLTNEQTYEAFESMYADYQVIAATMQEQMSNRSITFSMESGVITTANTSLTLTKDSGASAYELRYTLDGSLPDSESTVYGSAISLSTEENTMVRAALFLGEQRVSPVYTESYTVRIPVSGVEVAVDNWGAEYLPEFMIDGDSSTRWASYGPSGDIEIFLSFEEETTMNAMTFEQYVSNRNGVYGFEIWALENDAYTMVCQGDKIGDESDSTSLYYAAKTIEFEEVTTTSIKLVLKEGYLGEPTFYEIQPLFFEAAEDAAGDAEELSTLLVQAEAVDRTTAVYQSVDADLTAAFEESIRDAQETAGMTQAEIDSREAFLRNRYERLLEALAQYSAINPFVFPSELNETATLEAEYLEIHNTGTNERWPMKVAEADWASNGKVIDAANSGDSAVLYYNAPVAGIYTVTVSYRSGDTRNAFSWSEADEKITAGTVTMGASDSAAATHTGTFTLEVVSAGEGVLTFAAGAYNAPQLDKFEVVLTEIAEVPEPPVEVTPVTEIFVDVAEGAWYVDSVQYVYDQGIIVGDGNIFNPDGATTRAMVAVILYRMEGSPEVTQYTEYNKFTDLPAEHVWYSDAVAWALNEEVSTGDDVNMLYNPNSSVTREQLALFLWRYTKYKGENVTVERTADEILNGTYVSDWAKEGFVWAVDRGIIRGAENMGADGQIQYELLPQGGATRAQLARMLHRFCGGTSENSL